MQKTLLTADSIMEQLCSMNTSTTHYIEAIACKPLNVTIVRQEQGEDEILYRKVLLSVSSEEPLFYCESSIYLGELEYEQRRALIEGIVPIGRIFAKSSNDNILSKKNICLNHVDNPCVCELLAIKTKTILCKHYDFCVRGQIIARISEYFCRESIQRLLPNGRANLIHDLQFVSKQKS